MCSYFSTKSFIKLAHETACIFRLQNISIGKHLLVMSEEVLVLGVRVEQGMFDDAAGLLGDLVEVDLPDQLGALPREHWAQDDLNAAAAAVIVVYSMHAK